MRIAVVGYGRMGREIEQAALARGHTCSVRVDPHADDVEAGHTAGHLHSVDVAIEFSTGDAVLDNARAYVENHVSAVVGTTGWENRAKEVEELVASSSIGYLTGANFSLGANLFFMLAEQTAQLLDEFDDYEPMLFEVHHRGKRDSPSGTALEAARRVLSASSRKDCLVTEALHRPLEANEMHVASMRGGAVPGTHELAFDSAFDTIRVAHEARTRQGFAVGAVRAAEWLQGRAGRFTVRDFIESAVSGR